MIRADLHIHTTYSDDSTVTPKTLVEKLVAHNSIKVAAVTDHDTVNGLSETRKLAAAYPDILIIPGVEISTAEGDLLVLEVSRKPLINLLWLGTVLIMLGLAISTYRRAKESKTNRL